MLQLCCRTCLEPKLFSELRSLFDTYNDFVLRDALQELFQIKVQQTDMLSTICKQCVSNLCTARTIRKQFLEGNYKYRQMINTDIPETNDSLENKLPVPTASNSQSLPTVESTTQEDFEVTSNRNPSDIKSKVKCEEISQDSDDESVVYVLGRFDKIDEKNMQLLDYEIELVSNKPKEAAPERYEIIEYEQSDSEECRTESSYSVHPVTRDEENVSKDIELCSESSEPHYIDTGTFNNVQQHESEIEVESTNNTTADLLVQYYCEKCGKIYEHSEQLGEHIVSCKSIRAAKSCEEQVSKPQHYTEAKPSGEAITTSQMCSKTFTRESQLLKHDNLCHQRKLKVSPQDSIPDSGTDVKTKSKNRKSFQCRFCPKAYNASAALVGHENMHTRQQSFFCSVCDRSFAQYTSMRRHMKIHDDIKPHECDICHKYFRQRTVMLAHRRRHTGEKPYVCEVCQKPFRDHSTFSKHRRVHQLKPLSSNIYARKKNMDFALDS
ncbi:zinc finger protein 732-like [Anopheles ziemanni]|uniref:zinc finger protein 732-like n=1 Tax=Anopheles coustani TaxID=139045 RepID=UPI00265920C9|nr:zinc finger protein 732-like [Anopheles coustani]XP_058169345.1 zinc finger protein 732-like [Anopheles ziemanni]